jgi:hypothetical protein
MLIMAKKNKLDDLIEVTATKKYASVLLTPKEFRKGRKRWMEKHN